MIISCNNNIINNDINININIKYKINITLMLIIITLIVVVAIIIITITIIITIISIKYRHIFIKPIIIIITIKIIIIIIIISTRKYIDNKSASKAASTVVGTGKENYTIWHFGLSRSPGNKLLRHFESKYDEYCTFLCERFLFFIKVSSH